jgi:CRP-like cAMP-binding protein
MSGDGAERGSTTMEEFLPDWSGGNIACKECLSGRNGLFRPNNGHDRGLIAAVKQKYGTVTPGTDIVSEGERTPGLFTVCDGWTVRYHSLRSGKRQILDVRLPGDSFSLGAVLSGVAAHSVQALTAASICMLSARQVQSLLKSSASLAFGVLQRSLEEERRADARSIMLGRMSAEERVGYFMMDVFDRLRGRGMTQGARCPFPLRRIDLADAVGLSKVHAMRALRELRATALLEISGRELVIPDVVKLAKLTGYVPA